MLVNRGTPPRARRADCGSAPRRRRTDCRNRGGGGAFRSPGGRRSRHHRASRVQPLRLQSRPPRCPGCSDVRLACVGHGCPSPHRRSRCRPGRSRHVLFRRLAVEHPALFRVGFGHGEIPSNSPSSSAPSAEHALQRLEARMFRLETEGLLAAAAPASRSVNFTRCAKGSPASNSGASSARQTQNRSGADASPRSSPASRPAPCRTDQKPPQRPSVTGQPLKRHRVDPM